MGREDFAVWGGVSNSWEIMTVALQWEMKNKVYSTGHE